MPLRLPDGLPAIEILKRENIFVVDSSYAYMQDKHPLRIVILNLMPFKATTETDFIRILSNSPLLLDISFLKLKSHTSRHTPAEHIDRFYHTLEELSKEKIDGMIVTGAPVEGMPFEEVDYWTELQGIFNWAHDNVRSTLYICWAAQAGLYHFYDIPKYPLPKKMFGIFPTIPLKPEQPLFRGFDDVFRMPQSRHTEVRREDIERVDDLEIIAESEESGVSIVRSRSRREFFITGHLEYAPDTLDTEYRRDLGKRDDVEVPKYYYREDNPEKGPLVTWRSHANLLFMNWVKIVASLQLPPVGGETPLPQPLPSREGSKHRDTPNESLTCPLNIAPSHTASASLPLPGRAGEGRTSPCPLIINHDNISPSHTASASLPLPGGAGGGRTSPYKTSNRDHYDLLKTFSQENRHNQTEAEAILWEFLRGKSLGVKFRRQHVIGDYIADFICLSYHLVIELDGGYHHNPEQQELDKMRTLYLKEHGYTELRFTNEQILTDLESTLVQIKDTINLIKTTSRTYTE